MRLQWIWWSINVRDHCTTFRSPLDACVLRVSLRYGCETLLKYYLIRYPGCPQTLPRDPLVQRTIEVRSTSLHAVGIPIRGRILDQQ